MLDLQIIRTRHPPEAYLEQLTVLLSDTYPGAELADIRRRLELIPESDRFLLATSGESLIGYAHLRVVHDLLSEDSVELACILVAPGARRAGVGRRLMAAAETWALESGRARLLVRAEVSDSATLGFFAAQGFRATSTAQSFERDLERVRRAEAPTQPT